MPIFFGFSWALIFLLILEIFELTILVFLLFCLLVIFTSEFLYFLVWLFLSFGILTFTVIIGLLLILELWFIVWVIILFPSELFSFISFNFSVSSFASGSFGLFIYIFTVELTFWTLGVITWSFKGEVTLFILLFLYLVSFLLLI